MVLSWKSLHLWAAKWSRNLIYLIESLRREKRLASKRYWKFESKREWFCSHFIWEFKNTLFWSQIFGFWSNFLWTCNFQKFLFKVKLDWRAWNFKTKYIYIYLLRIQNKRHKNNVKTTWMTWNDTKWTIWYFQQCACVNAIYFAPVVTITYRMKNNKRSTRGVSLEMSVLARARAQVLNMLYVGIHLSLHIEKISRTLFYIYL